MKYFLLLFRKFKVVHTYQVLYIYYICLSLPLTVKSKIIKVSHKSLDFNNFAAILGRKCILKGQKIKIKQIATN